MIRFMLGLGLIIAGVGAAEGSIGLGTSLVISAAGIIVMVWGVVGMARKGQLLG